MPYSIMVENFLLGLLASIVANLLFLCVALFQWLAKRRLKWFWGPFSNRRAQITLSLIRGLDDPAVFRTRRVVTHLGDAQAATLVHSFLRAKLSTEAVLAIEITSPGDETSFVGIGGPSLNEASRNLLSMLSNSWELPFIFSREDDRWIIHGPYNSYELSDDDRYVSRDFGIIAKLPHPGSVAAPTGTVSSRCVCVLLAGISTFGTLAAARFALDPDCLKRLRRKLITECGNDLPYFMAIISARPDTNYTGVDMSSTHLIDVHPVSRSILHTAGTRRDSEPPKTES